MLDSDDGVGEIAKWHGSGIRSGRFDDRRRHYAETFGGTACECDDDGDCLLKILEEGEILIRVDDAACIVVPQEEPVVLE